MHVFKSENKVSLNAGDILVISVLVDGADLNAKAYGYAFELMYQNKIYDI